MFKIQKKQKEKKPKLPCAKNQYNVLSYVSEKFVRWGAGLPSSTQLKVRMFSPDKNK